MSIYHRITKLIAYSCLIHDEKNIRSTNTIQNKSIFQAGYRSNLSFNLFIHIIKYNIVDNRVSNMFNCIAYYGVKEEVLRSLFMSFLFSTVLVLFTQSGDNTTEDHIQRYTDYVVS